MVLAWLVVAERVTRWVPWALEGGLVWLVFGDVVVVVLELLLRLLLYTRIIIFKVLGFFGPLDIFAIKF